MTQTEIASSTTGNVAVKPAAEEWETRAKQAESLLESIFGTEAVWEWRTEAIPLPPVRVDPAGTITFDARVDHGDFSRGKEETRFVVKLSTPLRGAPIADIAELSQPGTGVMTVKIMPRAIQLGLGLGQVEQTEIELGDEEPQDEQNSRIVPVEKGVSTKTLQVRLLALGAESKGMPDGWKEWDQDRKDAVANWALAMTLAASDNDVQVPPAPAGLGRWYWGPGYVDEATDPNEERVPAAERSDDTQPARRRGKGKNDSDASADASAETSPNGTTEP